MKPEDINRAIAEHCGWKKVYNGPEPDNRWVTPDGLHYCTTKELPTYHDDLNAMHEAEKHLDEEQTLTQMRLMLPQPFCDRASWLGMAMLLQATAAQRAEAFLRTINKWKDE